MAFKHPPERRLRLVPRAFGDIDDRQLGFQQPAPRELHAPVGQVSKQWVGDERVETGGKDGSRDAGDAGEPFNGPRLGGLGVNCLERAA